METKHTPGPWVSTDIPSEPIVRSDELDVSVALCFDVTGDEQLANARLIAAAPDLLEALKAVKTILEDINFRHSNKKSFHNNRIEADSSTGIEIIQNAISKAKKE